eukprot:TRINITY_DN49037_c0_g1_i1.p1 TRINITY_DN49037_c0_g1~~TRINITY_DN49037_c0_g1_i1.p1  ORF type:complete len:727 (-),score=127.09 TRINITY_DN49037_c0_g1_i1:93-2099(-)
MAEQVSDPKSLTYGNYLSLEELRELIGSKHVNTVRSFLLKNGATSVDVTQTDDHLEVQIPAGSLEKMLDIKMYLWSHKGSGRTIHRTDTMDYEWPEEINKHIDLATGIHDFWEYKADRKLLELQRKQREAEQSANSAPDVLAASGTEQDVQVQFVPYCPDGKLPKIVSKTNWTCAKTTVDFMVIEFYYKNNIFPPQSHVIAVADIDCATGGLFHKGLTCVTPMYGTVPWRRVKITLQTAYSDGGVSAIGEALPFYAPTQYATPDVIRSRYNVAKESPIGVSGNSQSVGEFEKEYINMTDLRTYFRLFGLSQNVSPKIVGVNDPSHPGGESTLDTQLMMGVAHYVPTVYWSVSGPTNKGGYILTWATQVNNATHPPLVSSLSYSDNEYRFYEVFGSWKYIHRMEAELTKMTMRGLTVVISAGDAGSTNVGFLDGDLHSINPNCSRFRPQYPASSVWVTTVSSTFLTPNYLPFCEKPTTVCEKIGEAPVSIGQGRFWTTGGGFSHMFPQPEWQRSAVSGWESWAKMSGDGGLPPAKMWNASLRAYPDISTIGWNYPIIIDGKTVYAGGTSSSAPIFGALCSLLNEERLRQKKPPLGNINKLLYTMAMEAPDAFNDVVVGNNNDGQVQHRGSKYASTCPHGFQCGPGWDPATGLGTPNWGKMLAYINKNVP